MVNGQGLHLTPAQAAQANRKLGFISDKGLWGEFVVTNGTMATLDPVAVMQSKYSLSADQAKTFQGILAYANQKQSSATGSKAGMVHPDLHLDGTGSTSPTVTWSPFWLPQRSQVHGPCRQP